MILTDTGPLVALLDKDDASHQQCVQIAQQLPAGPMLTTWPCFTEAMYLLGAVGGYRYQSVLWSFFKAGRLVLHPSSPTELDDMEQLMKQYADTPMDLADASLVATANALALCQIFTIDSDFRIYRLKDGSVFEIL
ncbi:MAG: PIN domain nuclease [Cyanothece sp. SIO2G6]|nr:PIN domain nuclease [Cyanothece sp. SIO2G6]